MINIINHLKYYKYHKPSSEASNPTLPICIKNISRFRVRKNLAVLIHMEIGSIRDPWSFLARLDPQLSAVSELDQLCKCLWTPAMLAHQKTFAMHNCTPPWLLYQCSNRCVVCTQCVRTSLYYISLSLGFGNIYYIIWPLYINIARGKMDLQGLMDLVLRSIPLKQTLQLLTQTHNFYQNPQCTI